MFFVSFYQGTSIRTVFSLYPEARIVIDKLNFLGTETARYLAEARVRQRQVQVRSSILFYSGANEAKGEFNKFTSDYTETTHNRFYIFCSFVNQNWLVQGQFQSILT